MKNVPKSIVAPGHPDFVLLDSLKSELIRIAGGEDAINTDLPRLFRKAVDEIIDTPRTGRRLFSELEKTEKTYLGTKIEILFRNHFGLSKGQLDVLLNGINVDIKNTSGNNWMIPPEAFGQPCILLAEDETTYKCYVGIVITHSSFLGKPNRDKKCSIRRKEFSNILWILEDVGYPKNFWSTVLDKDAKYITEMVADDGKRTSGTERVIRLFTKILDKPIPRSAVKDVARQEDYMKRLRKNGGARDELLKNGIVALWGGKDSEIIKELGLLNCTNKQFISHRFTQAEVPILRKRGVIT